MGVEKRFTISPKNNQKICDNKEKKYYLSIDADALLKILNEFERENEELKQQIKELTHMKGDLSRKNRELIGLCEQFNLNWQMVIYDEWTKEFMEDMEKHYLDKRRVIKKRFCK
jgi:hypothetical protein